VRSAHLAAVLAALTWLAGCTKEGSPEAIADAFVDAYFVQADQEKAMEFTALQATRMLEDELREVAQVRKDGYNPNEARGEIQVRRGDPVHRDHRIRFPYQITIRSDGVETAQVADIELTQLQGGWKVVRVGMARAPEKP
jgi:hypothetical protein